MKTIKLTMVMVAAWALLASGTAHASMVFTNWNSGSLNTTIRDGDPTGISSAANFNTGVPDLIANVNVTLNLSGGYNGDLYGYLVLQSADNSTTMAILLNRVGRTGANDFGFNTSGMTVTLSGDTTQGYSNIHDVMTPGAGPYLADGRNISPLGDFTGSSSSRGLDVLNGHNANGIWTLFLADLSGGSESTLQSWILEINVVPEPTTWAMIIFGVIVVLSVVVRRSGLEPAVIFARLHRRSIGRRHNWEHQE